MSVTATLYIACIHDITDVVETPAAMKAPPKTKPNSDETSDIDPWDEEDQAPCPYEIPDTEPESPETGGMWRSTINAAIAAGRRSLIPIPDNPDNKPITNNYQFKTSEIPG